MIQNRKHVYGPLAAGLLFLAFGLADVLRAPEENPLTGDSVAYLRTSRGVARCLAHPAWALERLTSGGFQGAERTELGFDSWILQHAPLYVVSLGVAQAISPTEGSARLVSVLFLAGLGALLYDLGRRLFSPLVGAAACLLFLLNPAALSFGTSVLTEIPIAFLILLAGWVLVRWLGRMTAGWSLGLGLVLGALYLGKITLRPLPALLILVAAAFLWRRPDRVRPLAFLGLGVAVVLVPWWIGLGLAGLPANPFSETGEDMLWLFRGNNIQLQGWETVGAGDAITPELRDAAQEVVREGRNVRAAYRRAFFRQVREHPAEWLSLVGRKLAYFWGRPAVTRYSSHALWTMPPWLGPTPWIALAALAGWILCLGRRFSWIPALPALYLGAAHAASHLVARYSVPAQPLAALYACALPWLLVATARSAPLGRPTPRWLRDRALLWPLAAAAVGVVGWLVAEHPPFYPSVGTVRLLSWAGPAALGLALLAAGWLAGSLSSRAGLGRAVRWGWLAAGIAGLLLLLAARGSDPDWDEFSVRLERPGDEVVQALAIPRRADRPVVQGHVEMDLQRGLSDDFTLEVWIQERLAHTFVGGLGAVREDFILDGRIHGYQERHLRVVETLEASVEEYLAPKYGDENPGLDGIRRWVRLPLQEQDIAGRDTLRVRLVLRDAGPGAYVDLFGDQALAEAGSRRFTGPAFFQNPYFLSNYRYRLLEGDRREADYRLWTTILLESPWGKSVLKREGGPASRDLSREAGKQRGEYRIRLRLRLRGQYVWRNQGGQERLTWTSSPSEADRLPNGEDMRYRMSMIWNYFDGYATY